MEADLFVDIRCSECGLPFYRTDKYMFCVNQRCGQHEVKYQFPTIELKPYTEQEDD